MDFEFNPQGLRKCFIAYIDLLGFKELVTSKDWIQVFCTYQQCLEELHKHNDFTEKTRTAWFSDTFIIYSDDDSTKSFLSIELKSRIFVDNLISNGIPLRAALSLGEFYADPQNNIYFGKGLIDAYNFAEHQAWIGYILCPSVIKKMKDFGLEPDGRLNYVHTQVPFKPGFNVEEKLLALRMGENIKINGRNQCLDKLCELREMIVDEKIRRKYDLTIDFIKKYQLYRVNRS